MRPCFRSCIIPCEITSNQITPCFRSCIIPCEITSNQITPCFRSCIIPCEITSNQITPCFRSCIIPSEITSNQITSYVYFPPFPLDIHFLVLSSLFLSPPLSSLLLTLDTSLFLFLIKSFICPTNAHLNCFKILKFTLKITINAPKCFCLTKQSSGSLRYVNS